MLATLFLYIAMGVSHAHEPWVTPLAQYVEEVAPCVQGHIDRHGTFGGTIEVWVIQKNGIVSSIDDSDWLYRWMGHDFDSETVGCIEAVARKMVFLAPEDGGIFLLNDDPSFILLFDHGAKVVDGDLKHFGLVFVIGSGSPILFDEVFERHLPESTTYVPSKPCLKEANAPKGMKKYRRIFQPDTWISVQAVAERHRVSVRDVCDWNCVPEDHAFYPSEDVIIWIVDLDDPTPAVSPDHPFPIQE